jgi:chromosome segregation ATPase
MRLSTISRLAALVVLFGLMAYSLPAQDQDQSSDNDVAAAARKAREQQKKDTAPKKVLTNDDISPAKGASSDSSAKNPKSDAAAQADEHASDKNADKNADNDPKSETYWRKRFQKVRDQIAQAEQELDVMQRELDKAQIQYYPNPQTAMVQQHDRSEINDKTSQINAKKKQIDDLKQQLTDMEDELRKAGGDPGWAR